MKRVLSFIMLVLILCTIFVSCQKKQEVFSSSPEASAATSVYMYNFNSDRVVYEKESGRSLRPGSLAQLMTAMVVMDSSDNVQKPVESTQYSFGGIEGKALPNANIHEGETYTIDELLTAILVESNYDAANLLAWHFGGGNTEVFVEMMNQKAKEIGMDATEFANAHGAFDSEKPQSTTAGDVFKMTKYFVENYPSLYNKCTMSGYNIPARTGQNEIKLRNENMLTVSNLNSDYYDQRVKNIKYSTYKGMDEPYENLVTCVEDESGMRYLVVVMHSPYLGMPAESERVRIPGEDLGVIGSDPLDAVPDDDTELSEGEDGIVVDSEPIGASVESQTVSSSSSEEASSGDEESSSATSGESNSSESTPQPFVPEPKVPYAFEDTKMLIDWAFDTFKLVKQTEADNLLKLKLSDGVDKTQIRVGLSKKPKDFLPPGEEASEVIYLCQTHPFLKGEVKKGDIVGIATPLGVVDKHENQLQPVNLIALENSTDSMAGMLVLRFFVVLLIIVVVLFIVMTIIRMRNLAKRRERRRRRREQMKNAQSGSSSQNGGNIRKI